MFVRLVSVALLAACALVLLARPSVGAGPERQYRVRPADTLWSIAAAHSAGDPREAVWKLQRRNHLSSATIRPGQTLVLPG